MMTEPGSQPFDVNLPWHVRAGLNSLSPADRSRLLKVDWRNFDKSPDQPQLAWLGHATFYIAWKGLRILIDPVFSRYVGIVPRRCPTPPDWQQINPDLIFLSHAHMDHMDMATLDAFRDTQLVLPSGSERFLAKTMRGQSRLVSRGETLQLGSLTVRCVTAMHGGWRYPWQRGCHALGYAISDGSQTILYAGDTAYGDHFSKLAQMRPEIALLPIGAYSPAWFLAKRHMNPEEAIAASVDCQAKSVIPFHFGAYRLSLEAMDEPFRWFSKVAGEQGCNWYLPVGI